MRKKAVLFICILLGSSVALSQQRPALSKDAQAEQLAQQVLSANGPVLAPGVGTITTGTIQLAGDANFHPIRIYALGNSESRAEIDRSTGTSVRILHAGRAAYQSPGGKIIRLNLLNTVSERILHLPMFSIVSEYASPNVQLEYVGPAQLSGLKVIQFSVSWSAAATAEDEATFLKRTRVVYSVDPATCRILEIEFDHCAENDTNNITHYRVFYTNYQTLGGRSIPTTIITFANDAFSSELHIGSYIENSPISASFVLPEDEK